MWVKEKVTLAGLLIQYVSPFLMAARIGGDFLFPLLYLGLWRVTEIIQRLIVLGGGAFHQERENTAQRQCLRLWLSREQSLCCWYS